MVPSGTFDWQAAACAKYAVRINCEDLYSKSPKADHVPHASVVPEMKCKKTQNTKQHHQPPVPCSRQFFYGVMR